jgi:hypothetical protein
MVFCVLLQLGLEISDTDPRKSTLSKKSTHFASVSAVAVKVNIIFTRMKVGINDPSLLVLPIKMINRFRKLNKK